MSSFDIEEAESAGEGYFASVSDLMVGILFVFLLMLTVFALNYRNEEDKQVVAKRELDLTRQQLDFAKIRNDFNEQKNEKLRALLQEAAAQLQLVADQRQQLRAQLLSTLKSELEKSLAVEIEVDPDSGILRLPGDLLFAKDRSELDDRQRARVIQVAKILGTTLPCYSTASDPTWCASPKPILDAVLVEGHSDKQRILSLTPEGSEAANDRLSTDRALAVFKILRQKPSRLDDLKSEDGKPLFGVSAYGERRPLPDARGETEADYRRNRRIDIRFVLSPRTSKEFQDLQAKINEALASQ